MELERSDDHALTGCFDDFLGDRPHLKATGANDWYVFDHLRRHSMSGGHSKERAVFIARVQEHAWRQRCDRWQQAEYRDSPP